MGLSRLDNFLKNLKGEIIYVDSNNIDATDSIENQGNSLARPFKTLQRALIEAARFSYQGGKNNDRYNKTTILLYPGDHYVDNRPGWIPTTEGNFLLRGGVSSNNFFQFSSSSNFDLTSSANDLYKLNSVHGGIIVPRGTSIVGMDLRKTKIIPRYVPNPENDNIERSAIFRVTGACYFWQMSILDSSLNDFCYKDYTNNKFIGNFSHHKLTAFEYADGVNSIIIDDEFVTYSTDRTDLDMYYEKIGLAFGVSSGRNIPNDYPSLNLDIQPRVEEYRIVGTRSGEVGISSIRSGDGVTSSTLITAILSQPLEELDVDSIIRVEGINSPGYDGEHVVKKVINQSEIQYEVLSAPLNPNPSTSGSTLNIIIDTVDSASPYIFNCSLRSVYGMCGLHADGNRASGFKSMVVAQFTGIGLQKDNNAFVKYNELTGQYEDTTTFGNENIHTDSRARFKPSYENYHIKCSNDGYIQVVSVFAIGYANHFLAESGGDQSINNSNSNFGSRALVASGFRNNAFPKDDIGYITHIIPPEHLSLDQTNIEFYSLDVLKTSSNQSNSRLYLFGETNVNIVPEDVFQGYKIGANEHDRLNLIVGPNTYSAKIVMPNTESSSRVSSKKENIVSLNISGISSISNNVLTFSEEHEFITGESIKIFSDDANLPLGIEPEKLYYAITAGSNITNSNNQIKVAQTLDDALNDNEITINPVNSVLRVVSRVSDKNPGEIGHPIQFDSSQNNWYINVSSDTTGSYPENSISDNLTSLVSSSINSTSRTFFNRTIDNRKFDDRLYRLRYVIPSDSPFTGRPPLEGYVIQESNSTIGQNNTEIGKIISLNNTTLNNSTELRNFRIISDAQWSSSGIATFTTEFPHDLLPGSEVEIVSVASTNNTSATNNFGYNGTFEVTGITTSYNQFSVRIPNDPGAIVGSSSLRTTSIPRFKKKKTNDTLLVYRSEEVQEYIKGKQDGIYNLVVLNSSNSPKEDPFKELKFLQPVINLYPQIDKDNPISDPKPSICNALSDTIGKVTLNNPQYSETKETLNKLLLQLGKSTKISSITNLVNLSLIASGFKSYYQIETTKNHGLNPISSVSITNFGSGYGSQASASIYNVKLVGGSGNDATALVSVNATGQLTGIKIINGGSGYTEGDTLTLSGIPTFSPFTQATITVDNVLSCIDEVIQIEGFNHQKFNTLARIISAPSPNKINIILDNGDYHQYYDDVDELSAENASYTLIGSKAISFTSVYIDNNNKTATITLDSNHNFKVNDIIRISNNTERLGFLGFGLAPYFSPQIFISKNTKNLERNFRVVSTTGISITIYLGNLLPSEQITTTASYQYEPVAASNWVSFSGLSSKIGSTESINNRLIPFYGGVTGTISAVSSPTTDQITVSNLSTLNLNIGDYLQIGSEIVRIKSTVSLSPSVNLISVYRGVLGSKSSVYPSGTIIRRISPIPIEFRRNSLIRASAHTFEYIGFGPGNYSTAFPEKQDRKLSSDEEKYAHSLRIDGGVSVFSSMNADGNFYIGNKKINSSSGKEETFDIPVPSNVGENDYSNPKYNIIQGDKLSAFKSIRVEGGRDSKDISEFGGEVVFNNKVTSTSIKGLEAVSIYLQGDETISRKYTISSTQPTQSGNPGDIVYNSNPASSKEIGWIYTSQNQWEQIRSSAGIKLELDDLSTTDKYITFSDTQSSEEEIETLNTSTKIKYNPSEGKLSSTSFVGDGENLTTVYPQALKPLEDNDLRGSFKNYLYETKENFTLTDSGTTTISSSNEYGNTVFTNLNTITVQTGSTLKVDTGTKFVVSKISEVFSSNSSSKISGIVDYNLRYSNNGSIANWIVGQKGDSDSPRYLNDSFVFTKVNPNADTDANTLLSISADGIVGVNDIETMFTAPSGSIDKLQSLVVRPRPGENGVHASIIASDSRGPAELRIWNSGTLAEWLVGQRSEVKSDFTISKLASNTVTEMFSVSTDGVVGIHTVTNMIGVSDQNIDRLQALQIRPRPGQSGAHLSIIGNNSNPAELRIRSENNIAEWLVGQNNRGSGYDLSAFKISKLASQVVTEMFSVSADGVVGIHTVTNMIGVSDQNIDRLQALQIKPRPGQTGSHLSIIGSNFTQAELRIWNGSNIAEWLVGQNNSNTTGYDLSAFKISKLSSQVVTTMLSVSADGLVGINTVTNMDGVQSSNVDINQTLQIMPRPGQTGNHLLIRGTDSSETGLRIWNGNNISEWIIGQRPSQSNLTISSLTSNSITARMTVATNGTVTAASFSPTSDINLKTNINQINNCLDLIKDIRGVSFKWKESNEKSLGVVAQEIETVLPELISEIDGVKNVNYNGIVAVLIECIKEQQKQIEDLKNVVNNL